MRGWFIWLRKLLDGSIPLNMGPQYNSFIDPTWGLYPRECRVNKDEVGGYFGDPSRLIVSEKGEKGTKILVIVGWGERICTMIFIVTAIKFVRLVGLVFRGKGTRISQEEEQFYKNLKFVKVFFQSKAWVDGNIEMEVVRQMLIPLSKETRKDFEDAERPFPGMLLVEDNFSAHTTPYDYIIINYTKYILSILFVSS